MGDTMTYSTTNELISYATTRGYEIINDPNVLLTKANDWIETQNYKGVAIGETAWPRDGVYVGGVWVSDDSVPTAIKNAEMAMAIEIDKGNEPLATLSRATKREKVGDLEVEYTDSALDRANFVGVIALIKPYLTSSTGYDR
jgi:hypothetical protein